MNKSKFLKKSLAMVLAVMLVVAMIPMSASAGSAFVNDGVIVNIGTAGTLTGSGQTWKDALAYDADGTDADITISAKTAGSFIDYKIDDDEDYTTTDAGDLVIPVDVVTPGMTKVVQFYVTDAAGKESKVYTVTVSMPEASNSTKIKTAAMTVGGAEIKGTVDNAKQTIAFVLPWGATAANSVDVVMESATEPETIAISNGEITVTAQNGDTAKYTITTAEAACLLTLSIDGVKAVQNKTNEGELIDGEYTVTLPTGTDLTKELPLVFTTAKPATAKWGETDVKSNESYVFVEEDVTFTLTDKDGNEKEYTVTVEVADSTDTTISAFTATVDSFTEDGVIAGDKLTVTLPSTTDADALKAVLLKFTVAKDAKVAIGNDEIPEDGKTVDLTQPVLVKVTAADGKTVAYYQLTATVAENPNKDPKITAAKLTVDADTEITGTVKDKTITFAVPYATADSAVKDITKYSFAKTPATTILNENFANFTVDGKANYIRIGSDGGDVTTYTVVFEVAKPETGKTISKFSLVNAATAEEVTDAKTYAVKVGTDKLTVTLPYSVYEADATKLVAQFTLSKGAKFFNTNDNGSEVQAQLGSGFNEEGTAPVENSEITVAALKADAAAKAPYIVADEYAAAKINAALTEDGVTVEALKKSPYKGHVTLYTPEVVQAAASKEKLLKSLETEDGVVTSKIDNTKGSVEISAPGSYDSVAGSEFDFTAKLTASTGATIKVNNIPVVDDKIELAVVAEKLNVKSGSSYAPVTSISVTSEAGETKVYNTIKTTLRAMETGAVVTSLKVNKTNAVIDNAKKTITVILPYNTDLTDVTMDGVVSKMAHVAAGPSDGYVLTGTGTFATAAADGETPAETVDVSEKWIVQVMSEDTNTVNTYTLTATVAEQFSDIKDTDWFYPYVMDAATAGIVEGRPDGTFGPKDNVKRRDFALMVVRMLDADVSKYTTTPFSDVKSDDYALQAIAYCAEEGIIGGDGNGKFRPGDTITRQEAAKIVATALKLTNKSTDKFKDDASIANWAKDYVYACKAAGIFEGTNNVFNPKSMITRAETAKVLSIANNK